MKPVFEVFESSCTGAFLTRLYPKKKVSWAQEYYEEFKRAKHSWVQPK